MSEDSGQYPRSPFAPSPSARPPSVDDIRMQVRVPPPSHRAGSQSSVTSVDPPPEVSIPPEPDALVAAAPEPEPEPEPVRMPSDELLPSSPSSVESLRSPPSLPSPTSPPDPPSALTAEPLRGRRRPLALIAAGAGVAVVVVAVLGARFMTARREPSAADPSASAEQASAPVSAAPAAEPPAAASAVASAPIASASADVAPAPPPVASASASASAKRALKPFDPNHARTALNALVPKLSSCKLTKGGAWSVKVTYAPDGHVVSAVPAGKHSTAHNACVSAQLKQGSVEPFAGKQTPYLFKFVAGSK